MDDVFSGLRKDLQTLFWPKGYFAWQTLLWLSFLSLLVAIALDSIEGDSAAAIWLLRNLSWVFFTCAIWWAFSDTKQSADVKPIKVNNFSLGPWITGIVLCLFLFRPWTDDRFRWALSCWPVVSTIIMALPKFVSWDLKARLPDTKFQKTLVMTALVNLLLSSWIMFHFRVQDWVNHYPSLLVRPLEDSAFVYDFVQDRQQFSQGGALLQDMANAISLELNNQPWYQSERWLYTRQPRLETISRRALNELTAPDEAQFWRIAVAEPREFGEGYLLDLRATWAGPTARETGFFLEKTCKIVPVDRPRAVQVPADQPPPTSQITSVDCGEERPVEQWVTAAG
ncbi:MAG: DUF5357 family protein [Cyanobacteria bacterium J06623_4]